MTPETIALVLTSLGLGGGIVEALRAISQRRKIGADAVAVISAAASELVEPLRRELANERREHALELEAERKKVAEVRDELGQALEEARELRGELAMARVEADELRRDRETYRARDREKDARIRTLERQLADTRDNT